MTWVTHSRCNFGLAPGVKTVRVSNGDTKTNGDHTMRKATSHRLLAALLGAGAALIAMSAAAAAPAQAASPTDAGPTGAGPTGAGPTGHRAVLSVTATDLEYGQPDLHGTRGGTNTITVTNTGRRTVQYPMLTFPTNERDTAQHGDWRGCAIMFGHPGRLVCILEPLAPGGQRTLTPTWSTRERGPAGTALVRVEVAADNEGNAVRGTAREAIYQVSFAPLTGTFDITASALVYAPADAAGIQRGSTTVTVTNLTDTPVAHPVVSFPPYAGVADETTWTGCVALIPGEYVPACVLAPLAPGEQRALPFGFLDDVNLPGMEYDSHVQVAAADEQGNIIDGTAAGTWYPVSWSD